MFSDAAIARYIDENFEPVWESVRPVPMITFDFGNGRKLKRTLHGNIASYVCTADGKVVDVLPGLYKPLAYQQSLAKLVAVAKDAEGAAKVSRRSEFLRKYHALANLSIKQHKDSMKMTVSIGDHSSAHKVSDVVTWPESTEETTINEYLKRNQIHSKLELTQAITPAQLKPWLYKDVLHCDLADPYLGLQSALFDNYPFVD